MGEDIRLLVAINGGRIVINERRHCTLYIENYRRCVSV